MVSGRPAAIVLDVDGTLIDSVPEVAAALNVVLAAAGRRYIGVDETLDMVGEGAVVTLEKAFAATGEGLTVDDLDRTMQDYLTAYKRARGANTAVYPGVREVLDELWASGVAMSVCTNKPAATTLETLEALGLRRYFDPILCPDHVSHRKPDGRHVLACLDGVAPADAVMVGDSETDMAAARDAGVQFVAVSYGYSHVPIVELGADAVIARFGDLPAALMELKR